MRMDLVKPRYETFDELYEYRYRVAGTVGLMSMPFIMGCDENFEGDLEKVYKAALSLGLANHADEHPARRRRGRADAQPHLHSPRRAGGFRHHRGGDCARRASTPPPPERWTIGGRRS